VIKACVVGYIVFDYRNYEYWPFRCFDDEFMASRTMGSGRCTWRRACMMHDASSTSCMEQERAGTHETDVCCCPFAVAYF
jgi:hypothetical protein